MKKICKLLSWSRLQEVIVMTMTQNWQKIDGNQDSAMKLFYNLVFSISAVSSRLQSTHGCDYASLMAQKIFFYGSYFIKLV